MLVSARRLPTPHLGLGLAPEAAFAPGPFPCAPVARPAAFASLLAYPTRARRQPSRFTVPEAYPSCPWSVTHEPGRTLPLERCSFGPRVHALLFPGVTPRVSGCSGHSLLAATCTPCCRPARALFLQYVAARSGAAPQAVLPVGLTARRAARTALLAFACPPRRGGGFGSAWQQVLPKARPPCLGRPVNRCSQGPTTSRGWDLLRH